MSPGSSVDTAAFLIDRGNEATKLLSHHLLLDGTGKKNPRGNHADGL